MLKNFTTNFVHFCLMIFFIFALITIGATMSHIQLDVASSPKKPSILHLELDGPIIHGKEFLKNLRKYRGNDNIKGILLSINSPGGVVGPSQEIYSELLKVREEFQKPIVVSSGAVVASGAYYVALAADQIVTSPGTLMGSIGVIMEFANLEGFYDWIKIKPYIIKTGDLKDAGTSHREMTQEEKSYFQSMLNRVQAQFESAVEKSRKLDKYIIDKYADGRVFTGETAVKVGFADQVGTQSDALRIVGELANLGANPEVFSPPKKYQGNQLFEMIFSHWLPPGTTKSFEPSLKSLQLLGKTTLHYAWSHGVIIESRRRYTQQPR